MIATVARRGLSAAVTFAIASVLVFLLGRMIPGDPVSVILGSSGQGASEETVRAIRERYNLDEPLPIQYLAWLGQVFDGSFGHSYANGIPVSRLILERLIPTLELATVAVVLAFTIAVVINILAARFPRAWLSRNTTALATVGIALPEYWVGVLLIAIFSVRLGWLPSRGYAPFTEDPLTNLLHLVLPVLTLALVVSAPLIRYLRASFVEVGAARFVRTATGKGLPRRRVLTVHVLPNGLMPAITALGLIYGQLVGGVVTIEYIFNWPGLGSLALKSILSRDYAVLQGVVMFAVLGFLVTSFAVDAAYRLVNPRLRTAGGSA